MARIEEILLPIAGAVAGLNPYIGSAIRSGATVAEAMGRRKDAAAAAEEEAAAEAAEAERRARLSEGLMALLEGVPGNQVKALQMALMGGVEPERLLGPVTKMLEPPKAEEPGLSWEQYQKNLAGMPPDTSYGADVEGMGYVQSTVPGRPKPTTKTAKFGKYPVVYNLDENGRVIGQPEWPLGRPPPDTPEAMDAIEFEEANVNIATIEAKLEAARAKAQPKTMAGQIIPPNPDEQAKVVELEGKLSLAKLKRDKLLNKSYQNEAPTTGGEGKPVSTFNAMQSTGGPPVRRFDAQGNPVP